MAKNIARDKTTLVSIMNSIDLVSFFCLLLASSARADKIAHIFLNAGQSNSEGFNSDGHTDEDVAYDNIWQLDCCFNGTTLPYDQCKFAIAQDPLHHQCDYGFINGTTVGYAMSFARAYREDIPSDDIIIIVPAGIGGTGFFDGTWIAYEGRGYKAAVAKITQAYNLVEKTTNHTPKFEGVIWQHGTHDAGDNAWGLIANTTQYLYDDMIPLIGAFRNQSVLSSTYTELPFIVANLMPAWVANPAHPLRMGVFTAIALIDQIVPYTASVSSIGLEGDPNYPAGNDHELVHFTAKSQRILGKRYHAGYYLALANNKN